MRTPTLLAVIAFVIAAHLSVEILHDWGGAWASALNHITESVR